MAQNKLYLLNKNTYPVRPIAAFTSEDAVKDYLRDHIVFRGVITTPQFDLSYTLTTMPLYGTEEAEEVDTPYYNFFVMSEHTDDIMYGVAVSEAGVIYACSCPSFEFHGGPCKHMDHLYWLCIRHPYTFPSNLMPKREI